MLLSGGALKNIIFLDIETVSAYPHFEDLPENFRDLWALKCQMFQKNSPEPLDVNLLYNMKAGIYSEFAKIVCISVGYLQFENNELVKCKLKSFADHDEKKLLQDFSNLMNTHYNNPEKDGICGHNIKEFDIPFICRRLVINRMPLPSLLDLSGKKPWQTAYMYDTMEMWRFGDYKNYTSLNLLAATLGIDTPKDDIDGSMVGKVYWEDNDLPRIASYCQKDVLTVMQVMLTFAAKDLIRPELIEIA
jgi:uncharacterized protein YprB with RNaseH-like and TPR domain